jgi:hypothetical protein
MMRTFLAAAFLITGATASAETLTANIPFAFHVPGAQLPAGKYMMTRASYPNFDAWYFRNTDSTRSHLVASPIRKSTGRMSESRVSFRCAQDQCELTEIQSAVQGVRNAVPPSLSKKVPGTEISWRIVEVNAAD